MISLPEVPSNTGDCRVLKFLRRCVDGKHLMWFRVETSFSTFSSVTGPKCIRGLNVQEVGEVNEQILKHF